MKNTGPVERTANDIPCGHAVKRPGPEDPETTYIKAERLGADYIHHYLVRIAPRRGGETTMIYVDPEEMLVDLGGPPDFRLAAGEARPDPAPGDIFENAGGLYLKAVEDPRSQKMFAFIDISSGRVKRRQQRGVITVYGSWRVNRFLPQKPGS